MLITLSLSPCREVDFTRRHPSGPMNYINYLLSPNLDNTSSLKISASRPKKSTCRYVRKLAEISSAIRATVTKITAAVLSVPAPAQHYKAATMRGPSNSLLCFYVEHLSTRIGRFPGGARGQASSPAGGGCPARRCRLCWRRCVNRGFRTCLTLHVSLRPGVGEAVRIEVKEHPRPRKSSRAPCQNGKAARTVMCRWPAKWCNQLRYGAQYQVCSNPAVEGRPHFLLSAQSMHHGRSPWRSSCVQSAYGICARAASGVNAGSTTHTLRHSYALTC